MGDRLVNNFTVIESVYGNLIVNRHCTNQAEALIKTGRPHIEGELRKILMIVGSLPGEVQDDLLRAPPQGGVSAHRVGPQPFDGRRTAGKNFRPNGPVNRRILVRQELK